MSGKLSEGPVAEGMTAANARAVERLCGAEPVLVALRPAVEVVPDMTPATIPTSGPPMEWERYTGGQRAGIVGGALFEGLAADPAEADRKLRDGRIRLRPCHHHGLVGSLAGTLTASSAGF